MDPAFQGQSEDGKTIVSPEKFLAENLRHERNKFDGVLCWDVPDYLNESLVKPMVTGRTARSPSRWRST